ncbi:MAG: 16S rRNA (guanine(966)-N(2))-methyltransferase RsmD [Sphingosinicella sp.]|uniref:16S rRNA (guanine(966)-N(2))-methyltransferase RsmD n=1 Tax=Sphingosinicella sp. TaxID=1917971 RepID=UPI00403836E9
MRIIAGAWRGRPLAAPTGQATRPTGDRAREGLFSMLASRLGSFEDLRVADLFAGTGALGLEALSRGAAHCTFYEKDRAALDALKRNIDRLGAIDRAEIRAQPVEHALPPAQPCDLILLDPPYATGLAQAALDRIGQGNWLAPGGWLSIETAGESLAFPPDLVPETERRFGKAVIFLIRDAV